MRISRFGVSGVVLRAGVVAALAATAGWSGAGCGRSRPLDPRGPAIGIDARGAGDVEVGSTASALFVAVGGHGTIVTSPDGIAWTTRPMSVELAFASVAAGPSRIVAVGARGVVVTSRDGIVWEHVPPSTASSLRHVIYAGDRFVAVGEDWTLGATTLTSPDGVTWTAMPSPPDQMFHAVAHGGGTLIAAASRRSDLATPLLFAAPFDGVWYPQKGPDFYASLEVAGMIWVAGSGTTVSVSADRGAFWQSYAPGGASVISGLAFGGGTFVAVGLYGRLFTSPDGKAWTQRESPLGQDGSFYAATHGGGNFVAVGFGGKIVTSPDGVTWTSRSSSTAENLMSVAYGPTLTPKQ